MKANQAPGTNTVVAGMYDLHCHMLPGIDDGARDLDTALEMARVAKADGITHIACTPHIYPGLFNNTPEGIAAAVKSFNAELVTAGIAMTLSYGADIQVVPELLAKLRSGVFPTINGSRYFLFEPSHHVPLPNLDRLIFDVVSAGYVPVITHPERLTWIDGHYDQILAAAEAGAWMQITAGSLTGRMGSSPKYWSERMLDDGAVHLLATDAHNLKNRAPLLAEGAEAAIKHVGEEEAQRLVLNRPRAIWENIDPAQVPLPPGFDHNGKFRLPKKPGFFSRWF